MKINRLDWDSEFFGLRIGRVEIVSEEDAYALAVQRDLLKNDFDLIYVFANHGLGFFGADAKKVDEKVVYVLSGNPCLEPHDNVVLWNDNKGVTDDLLHLALISGKYSRFRLDERFPFGSYERLYSRWIEQSVNHTIASEVFCYMVGEVPRGLATLDRKNYNGTIGLVAVHDGFQQRGIGTTIIQQVIHYAQKQRCRRLTVATQLENVSACKLYEKCGFQVDSVTDVWHWWI